MAQITEEEPKPKKLLDQVRDALRVKHYSYRTEDSYVQWIRRYIPECLTQVPQSLSGSTSYRLDAREPNLVIKPLPCLFAGKTRFRVMLKEGSQL
jgi:hypothetical protein